jgi:hypothetical protein
VSANIAGLAEPEGIVDLSLKGESRLDTNAGYGHQPLSDRILAGDARTPIAERLLLLHQRISGCKQGHDNILDELILIRNGGLDLGGIGDSGDSAEFNAKCLESAANVILQFESHLD